MKKYFPITKVADDSHSATHLKIEIRYELGGYSYATGRNSRRGYYAYVSPVTIEKKETYSCETTVMFNGFKSMIKEVKRKSKKAETESQEILTDMVKFEGLKAMARHEFAGKYEFDWTEDTTV